MKSFITVCSLILFFISLNYSESNYGHSYPWHVKGKKYAKYRLKYHQRALEKIAHNYDGNRAAGTKGCKHSEKYVKRLLRRAGYKVTTQDFEFPFFKELTDPVFQQVSPNEVTYTPSTPESFFTMTQSGAGNVQGFIQSVDVVVPAGETSNTSNSGCEIEDFNNFESGKIALVQRGTCYFRDKALNAQAAGAIAVIMFNEGQEGRTDAIRGSLAPEVEIPVIFVTYDIGVALYELTLTGEVEVSINVDVLKEMKTTHNIFAETRCGSDKTKVIIGAHIDSAPDGPGINDNGSGTSAILETAIRTSYLNWYTKNKICYAFWGAEELGLLGSEHYVENLTEEEKNNIAMYLNFDMLGSSNYVRMIYDGDGSEFNVVGPEGSDEIEHFFEKYFKRRCMYTDPTQFSGRSDYAPFMNADIPIGGLFTGADEIKTEEQAKKYGGTAGERLDPNYHTADDNTKNNNFKVETQMYFAIVHAVKTFAFRNLQERSLVQRFNARGLERAYDFNYDGPHLQK